MEPLLEVKKLTKTFQKKGQEELAAVDHVSFCLLPGETLGIVGESGSGKSTVARMITGLLKPWSPNTSKKYTAWPITM